jgi:hypothetical protein
VLHLDLKDQNPLQNGGNITRMDIYIYIYRHIYIYIYTDTHKHVGMVRCVEFPPADPKSSCPV